MTTVQYFQIAFDAWTAIICLIGGIIIFFNRSLEPKASWTMIGVLLTDCLINIAESVGFIFDGRGDTMSLVLIHVAHFTVAAGICILTIMVAMHFGRMIVVRGGKARPEVWLSCLVAVINLAGLIVSQFFGFYYTIDAANRHVHLPTYPIFIAICELGLLPILIMVLKNRKTLRKREFIGFLAFCILTGIGGVLQLVITEIPFFNINNSVALLIVVLMHELEFSADTISAERQLSLARVHTYQSQIQPHFIYNSLTAIRSQLPPDSEAVETLNHFTGFLRGTIDVMSETECIPAKQELKTVDHYLFLEKTRFGDKLTVKMDIRNTDFVLPAFTIQLLVENAIRHGIREKEDGRGTVTIATYQTREANVIEVTDNGVGFDTSILDEGVSPAVMLQELTRAEESEASDADMPDPSASHDPQEIPHQPVGLINLKNRLNLMCGGTLMIESIIGKGTQAWVRIPRKKTKREPSSTDLS